MWSVGVISNNHKYLIKFLYFFLSNNGRNASMIVAYPKPALHQPPPDESTVNLALNDCGFMSAPPETVTVASYIPAVSPVFGVTVKLSLSFADMPGIVVLESVKLEAFAPDKSILSTPIVWFPMLYTVTLYGACTP